MTRSASILLTTKPSRDGYRTTISTIEGIVIYCWAPTRHRTLCEATALYLRHCRNPGRKVPAPAELRRH